MRHDARIKGIMSGVMPASWTSPAAIGPQHQGRTTNETHNNCLRPSLTYLCGQAVFLQGAAEAHRVCARKLRLASGNVAH